MGVGLFSFAPLWFGFVKNHMVWDCANDAVTRVKGYLRLHVITTALPREPGKIAHELCVQQCACSRF